MSAEHILVALDHSECAHLVAEEATQIALTTGARLTFVHAIAMPQGMSSDVLIAPDPDKGAVAAGDYLRADAEGRIAILRAEAEAKGVTAYVQIEQGEPAEVILAAAERLNVRMIVMGTHGRRGIARLLLGSVAEEVLRRATCPVLSVRSVHRPECEARSCGWCKTHLTDASRQVAAELEG